MCGAAATSCADGLVDGDESDVDCGGATCGPCDVGRACVRDDDCATGMCSGGTCAVAGPTCTDGVRDGDETDVDCGGGGCPSCSVGRACSSSFDCQAGACRDGICS